MIKGLQQQLWGSGTGEVQTHNLVEWKEYVEMLTMSKFTTFYPLLFILSFSLSPPYQAMLWGHWIESWSFQSQEVHKAPVACALPAMCKAKPHGEQCPGWEPQHQGMLPCGSLLQSGAPCPARTATHLWCTPAKFKGNGKMITWLQYFSLANVFHFFIYSRVC